MTATPLAVTILHAALATLTFIAGVCLALGYIPTLLAALALVVLIALGIWWMHRQWGLQPIAAAGLTRAAIEAAMMTALAGLMTGLIVPLLIRLVGRLMAAL